MSAESRECPCCHQVKELTLRNWYHRDSRSDGFELRCRVCRNARKLQSQHRVTAPRRGPGRPTTSGSICGQCYDLPHRVQGPRCPRCELEYAPLPPLDLADYLYRAPEREIV